MKNKAVLFFRVVAIIFFASVSFANQDATVLTEGAMIYKEANFDSPVIGYLQKGKKTRVSDKTYGPFYRIQLKPGVLGYISDVDVSPKKGRKPKVLASAEEEKKSPAGKSARWYGLGGTLGLIQYRELLFKKEKQSNTLVYGAKFTFPFRALRGPFFMDLSLVGHVGALGHYNEYKAGDLSAQWAWMDALLHFPLYGHPGSGLLLSLGTGPLLVYSQVSGLIKAPAAKAATSYSATEVSVGMSLGANVSYRRKSIVIRVEPKMHFEKFMYFGVLGSVLWAL